MNVLKKKSGSDGGVPLAKQSVGDELLWEFADDLNFLPDKSKQRKYVKNTNIVKCWSNSITLMIPEHIHRYLKQ